VRLASIFAAAALSCAAAALPLACSSDPAAPVVADGGGISLGEGGFVDAPDPDGSKLVVDGGFQGPDGTVIRADRFVTKVVSFTPGDCAGFGLPSMPSVVLGPPVGAGSTAGGLDVVSLGYKGEVVLGFAAGAGVGLVAGYAIARSRLVERFVSPYLVAAQAVPILALAPLLALWFGPGLLAKVVICGLIVFATGVAFDIYDRDRRKIWSDCAFWLHVVSAPMLVHPLFIMATGQNVVFGHIAPDANATIMLTILILGFLYVALAIDRRSLLVPTLAYFGSLGIYYLVNSASDSTGVPPFALILVVVGALIILFGAGWQRIRRIVVKPTLPAAVIRRLPPLKA